MAKKVIAKKQLPVARSRWWRLLKGLSVVVASWMLLSLLLVVLLRWLDPPTTALRIARQSVAWWQHKPYQPRSCWLELAEFGPNLPLAVIAGEDQRFSQHVGFDFVELRKALAEDGGPRRGASTISQQVAKNLFLWQGRSYLRKGLEVWFTLLIESCWSKRRILEIYLNIVEFGDGIYGGCAGASAHMNQAPIRLSPYQAALLAATLPNPHLYSARHPQIWVSRRANWIERQMRQLGGASYLAALP